MWLFLPILAVACFVLALASSVANLPALAITLLAVAVGLRALQLVAERRMSPRQFVALIAVMSLPALCLADGPCPGGSCCKNGICSKPLPPPAPVQAAAGNTPSPVNFTATKPAAPACGCKPKTHVRRCGLVRRLLHRCR